MTTINLELNVGLDRNDGNGTNTGQDVYTSLLNNLLAAGILNLEAAKMRYAQSSTEKTAVMVVRVNTDQDNQALGDTVSKVIHGMCNDLRQDCIAVIQDGKGALIGPLADKWGTFNQDYFINY